MIHNGGWRGGVEFFSVGPPEEPNWTGMDPHLAAEVGCSHHPWRLSVRSYGEYLFKVRSGAVDMHDDAVILYWSSEGLVIRSVTSWLNPSVLPKSSPRILNGSDDRYVYYAGSYTHLSVSSNPSHAFVGLITVSCRNVFRIAYTRCTTFRTSEKSSDWI